MAGKRPNNFLITTTPTLKNTFVNYNLNSVRLC